MGDIINIDSKNEMGDITDGYNIVELTEGMLAKARADISNSSATLRRTSASYFFLRSLGL
ncbi:hypothetical protein [Streptococcus moroccensis]|uniref:Uncharacterized protein n=1 Tax=Streptococcus moroccensis TaxID=1451356 RepID=A0ABT9YT76_9STRE|nr:hypothetical protein [Streptococcus moroccensis]MDQ0223180.1 hypothetical protein [Streptococcus moroccensis]